MLAELLTLIITYLFSPIDTILNVVWTTISKVTLATLAITKFVFYALVVLYVLKYGVGSLYAKMLLDRYFLYFLNSLSLTMYKMYRLGLTKSLAIYLSRSIHAILDTKDLKLAVYS